MPDIQPSEMRDPEYSLEAIAAFLYGAAPLDGLYYGETPPNRPVFWWRKHLRDAVARQRRAVIEGKIEELRALPSDRHEADEAWCRGDFFISSEDRWNRIRALEAELGGTDAR